MYRTSAKANDFDVYERLRVSIQSARSGKPVILLRTLLGHTLPSIWIIHIPYYEAEVRVTGAGLQTIVRVLLNVRSKRSFFLLTDISSRSWLP